MKRSTNGRREWVRQMRAEGKTYREIGMRLGVSHFTAWRDGVGTARRQWKQSGEGILASTRLRVLALVMEGFHRGRPFSFREMVKILGAASTNVISPQLKALADAGLIEFQSGRARTARPLVKFIPAEDIPCASSSASSIATPGTPRGGASRRRRTSVRS